MKPVKVEYVGKDLEAMDFAENYHRWILELFAPYLGKHFVEVGAGTGSFSKLLLEKKPESLSLIEPSSMFDELELNLPESASTNIITYKNIFREVADELATHSTRPDTFFYVNVLEHIEDELTELETVRQTLDIGGHVCIFVPAMPSLYSEFDKRLGHFRRYTKSDLVDKCEAAGFEICDARYFDSLGIMPWYVKYRLLRSTSLGSSLVRVYDKLCVPVMKRIENIFQPPLGKNLVIVAKKI